MARLASALSLGRARCFFGRAGESVASYLSDWVASASLAVVEAVSTVSVSCGCFWSRRRFRLFLFLWCWFRSPQWFRLFFISSWSRPVSVVSFVWVGVGLSVWFLGRKKCGGVVVAKKAGARKCGHYGWHVRNSGVSTIRGISLFTLAERGRAFCNSATSSKFPGRMRANGGPNSTD